MASSDNKNHFLASMPAFVAYMRQPSNVEELQAGPKNFSREEMQDFMTFFRTLDNPEAINTALRDFIPVMLEADSFHGAMLALLCGLLVERGGDPSILVGSVAKLLMHQLHDLRDYIKARGAEDGFNEMYDQGFPNAARAQASIDYQFSIVSSMAMLCRDVGGRTRWRARNPDGAQVIDELTDAGKAIPRFIGATFSLVDQQDLIIVDQKNQRVSRAHLNGVQEVLYHTFALLQDALVRHFGDGYLDAGPMDAECVRYAKNDDLSEEQRHASVDLIEELRVGFVYVGGLFIPGSMSFAGLPRRGETPYLLASSKLDMLVPHVQWNPNNMYPVLHEALRSSIDIAEELQGDDARGWLEYTRSA